MKNKRINIFLFKIKFFFPRIISSFYKKFGAKDLSYYSHEYNALPKAVKKIIAVKNKLS